MRPSRIALLALLLTLLPAARISTAKTGTGESVTIEVEGNVVAVDPADRMKKPPFQPGSAELEMVTDRPEGAPETPEGVTVAMHGAWKFQGKPVHLSLAGSGEDVKGFDLLFIDTDGDGSYGEGELFEMELSGRDLPNGSTMLMGSARNLSVTRGGQAWPFILAWRQGGDLPLQVRIIALWYLSGKVKVAEKMFVIDVLDAGADGSFSGPDDHWLLRGDGPVMRATQRFALSTLAEKRFFGDELFALNSIDGLKMNLTHGPASGPDQASQAAHRERVEHLWAEQFDQERDKFVEQFEIDTERPSTTTPIAWRYVTFDQAQAMAKAEGKPLFVDVLAFWCIWCYRMDYYTYPDAEVAEFMNTRFIPVKIIEEQDFAGDTGRLKTLLGARGIPAMGIWSAEGELLRFISGWKKPEEFLALLGEALPESPGNDPEEQE